MFLVLSFAILAYLELVSPQGVGDCTTLIEYPSTQTADALRYRAANAADCLQQCLVTRTDCLSYHYASNKCWYNINPANAYNRNTGWVGINYELPCRIPNMGSVYAVTAGMEYTGTGTGTLRTSIDQLADCHALCAAEASCDAWSWVTGSSATCTTYTGIPATGFLTMQANPDAFVFDLRSDLAMGQVCKDDYHRLTCGPGQGVSVLTATYGRSATSTSSCSGSNPASDCALDVTTQVELTRVIYKRMKAACNGRAECTINNPSTFGTVTDPCAGTDKYLEVSFICTPIAFPTHSVAPTAFTTITSIPFHFRAYPDYKGNGGVSQASGTTVTQCQDLCVMDTNCEAYEWHRGLGECYHYTSADTVCNTLTADNLYYHVKKNDVDCANVASYVGALYIAP